MKITNTIDVDGEKTADGFDDRVRHRLPVDLHAPDRLRMDQPVDVNADLLEQHDEADDLDAADARSRTAADEAREDQQHRQRERPQREVRDHVTVRRDHRDDLERRVAQRLGQATRRCPSRTARPSSTATKTSTIIRNTRVCVSLP